MFLNMFIYRSNENFSYAKLTYGFLPESAVYGEDSKFF